MFVIRPFFTRMPPARPKRPPLVRLHRLLRWVLVCVLFGQWTGLALVRKHVLFPLPNFARDRICAWFSAQGMHVNAQQIQLSLDGMLAVDSLSVSQPNTKEPVLAAQKLVLDFSLPDLLQGNFFPRHLFLDEATLFAPPSIAPSGERESVLQNLRIDLRRDGKRYLIKTAQGRFAHLPLVAYGEIPLPATAEFAHASDNPAEKTPLLSSTRWQKLHILLGKLLQQEKSLTALEQPRIEILSQAPSTRDISLHIRATAETLRLPDQLTLQEPSVSLTLHFQDWHFVPANQPAHIRISQLNWNNPPLVRSLSSGPIFLQAPLVTLSSPPSSINLWSGPIQAENDSAEAAFGRVDWKNPSAISARLALVRNGDQLSADATINTAAQSLQAFVSADLIPNHYLRHPRIQKFIPTEAASLNIPSRVSLEGDLSLAPQWRFEQAFFHAQTGPASFEQFRILGGHGNILLTPQNITLSSADLIAANYRARGSFSSGFTPESEFRFLLRGSAPPQNLNIFLPDWWSMLWDNLQLDPLNLGYTDIDISGQWEGTPSIFVYCFASSSFLSFHGRTADHAELRIVSHEDLIALYDILALSEGEKTTGTLQWHHRMPDYAEENLSFHFAGLLPQDTSLSIIDLFSPDIAETLDFLQTEQPPHGEVTGVFHSEASPTPDRVQLLFNTAEPISLSLWDFPIKNFSGSIAYDSDLLAITVNKASIAGGTIASSLDPVEKNKEQNKTKSFPLREAPSRIWINLEGEKPQVFFDAEILNAQQRQLTHLLRQIHPAPATPDIIDTKTTPAPALRDESQIDLLLRGQISLPDLDSLYAKGHIYLNDPQLGELHILGGLSRLLSKIGIDLASFHLNHAEGDFAILQKTVFLPHTLISGPNAKIDLTGQYAIEQGSLNFHAILTTAVGEDIPVLKHVFSLFNHLPNLIQVKISGTADNPKWELVPKPFAIIDNKLDTRLGTPPEHTPPAPFPPPAN